MMNQRETIKRSNKNTSIKSTQSLDCLSNLSHVVEGFLRKCQGCVELTGQDLEGSSEEEASTLLQSEELAEEEEERQAAEDDG